MSTSDPDANYMTSLGTEPWTMLVAI